VNITLRLRQGTALLAGLVLSACGSYGGSSDSGSGGGSSSSKLDSEQALFTQRVQGQLDNCRLCHVPGGAADVPEGQRFMLSKSSSDDYDKLKSSWTTLGKGVADNRILLKASNTDAQPHTGGSPWPKDGPAYNNVKALFGCWDNPAGCAAILAALGGGVVEPLPLLGDLKATGGANYARAYCEGQPDAAALPEDPRHLWKGDNVRNDAYATYFSDEFTICKTDTLYENQARQNAARIAQGKKPIHTANPPPKTCGEWRRATQSGLDWVTSFPTTDGLFPAAFVPQILADIGVTLPGEPAAANALLKSLLMQRYGATPTPEPWRNPFPLPGEDPNATGGGSGHLPLAFSQSKDELGNWTGKIGFSCLTCHGGALGSGEVGNSVFEGGNPDGSWTGMPNSNNDYGIFLWESQKAAATRGQMFEYATVLPTPGYVINTTRGTHAADNDVVQMFLGRDINSLEYRGGAEIYEQLAAVFTAPTLVNGDQDPPAWWWYHNKARYLWSGLLSTDATRGDMFFGAINSRSGEAIKADEHYFDDLNVYLDSMEAPRYPYGYCAGAEGRPAGSDHPACIHRPLAEQGAVLFHEKNLWADGQNSDIPQPKGNGSCAGCHGTYSPRYAQDPRFLPDPRLVGMTNYNVPMSILGTDSAYVLGPMAQMMTGQYPGFGSGYGGGYGAAVGAAPVSFWWGYPDAVEGYKAPDVEAVPPMGFGGTPSICIQDGVGGIETPPLHGVWGSAPYFHGGSVPSVWDVLKPDDRPKYWLRQRVPESMAAPVTGDRGFDHRLEAYDFDRMGWKYQAYASCAEVRKQLGVQCQSDASYNPFAAITNALYQLTGLSLLGPSQTVLTQPPLGQDAVLQRSLYDTTLFSKGNQGHEWTRVLTDTERRALVEYLKTL